MVIPSWYASPRNKVHGSFFKEQFKALQNSGEKISVAYKFNFSKVKVLL